jgi:thioredoxin-dependent peroxiredoxin
MEITGDMERVGLFKFNNQDVTVVGQDLAAGDETPEFEGQAPDWSLVNPLESTQGKVRIIGSLPSLNTSVCDWETRQFNQLANELGADVAVIMVSMDLPWTQKNWREMANVDQVVTLSDHRNAEFGEKYGVLLREPRIFRRAIFVVDRKDMVTYAAYLPVLGDEPDYIAVLEAARGAH